MTVNGTAGKMRTLALSDDVLLSVQKPAPPGNSNFIRYVQPQGGHLVRAGVLPLAGP